MTYTPPSTPLRQFRVLLTEDLDHNVASAMLSWRTFPCGAMHWDGTKWYSFPPASLLPVTSVDALRGALAEIAAGDWYEGRYPRRSRA